MNLRTLPIGHRIRQKMGDKYPEDLVIEVSANQIRFYPKNEPNRDSIYESDSCSDEDIDTIIKRITDYYPNK